LKNLNLRECIGFGVAGNFANHLEQAGEIVDFLNVSTKEANAPKGIFPFYVPNSDSFLSIFPIHHHIIKRPKDEFLQLEPEIALLCNIIYDNNNLVDNIDVTHFCAYNDCSIRKEGAKKISHKKNWGECSKGLSNNFISIDKFEAGGVIDNFSLASFIKRDNNIYEYGENSRVVSYNYFHKKLLIWIKDKLNNQEDFGPLENIKQHKKIAKYPKNAIISIGSTAYTDFGKSNYLEVGDKVFVIAYDHNIYSKDKIFDIVHRDEDITDSNISILKQSIIE
jgi:hypothetical protein